MPKFGLFFTIFIAYSLAQNAQIQASNNMNSIEF